MKVKFLIAAVISLISATCAFAQRGAVNDAETNYSDYQVAIGGAAKLPTLAIKAKTSLAAAKASIDKASTNQKTATLPETYSLKAAIYASLAVDDSIKTNSIVEYNTASDALKQAVTLDTKKENSKLIDHATKQLAQYQLNIGVEAYQNKKYDDAFKSFDIARQLVPGDTSTILYTAIAAINAKNYAAGITNYNALLKTSYSAKAKIYNDLPGVYLANKDTADALKVIDEALTKYPTNSDLRKLEIEIALQTGKTADVSAKLQAAIANDPKNKVLLYYAGLTYSQIADAANASAAKLKDTDPAKKTARQTAADNDAKSIEYYKKAVEIDPDYFEANLGLGYVLIKPAVNDFNKARDAKDDKDYNALRTKANGEFDLAKPYLQKAIDLKPKSLEALTNLWSYYRGKLDPAHAADNAAKAADIKKQMDALTK